MDVLKSIYEVLGMPTAERGAVRSSKWPAIRKSHLANSPACAACGDLHGHSKEVHHIVPVHIDPTRELDPDNLVTLCSEPCHIVFGHLFNWKNVNPEVLADAARILSDRHQADLARMILKSAGKLNFAE